MYRVAILLLFLGAFTGINIVFAAEAGDPCDGNNQCSTLFCLGGDNNIITGDAQGNSGVCSLGTPILISPIPDATDVPFTVIPGSGRFDWQDVSGAETYEIRYVRTTNNCAAIADALWTHLDEHPTQSKIDGFGSLIPDNGSGSGRYCWSVRAEASPFVSVWSQSRAFTTAQAVPPPPGDGGGPPGDGGNDGNNGNGGNGGNNGGGSGTLENPISAENLTDLFNKVFSFLFGLAIFIVPVVVIYAAFLMLMGGGDPVKLQKGRMILLWTAIAFAIILIARGLPVVFKNLL